MLIGESPPASGKFFYGRSHMTSYTARAFEEVHGLEFSAKDPADFLGHFKACGCYLDDVCHRPVDKLPNEEREQLLVESLPSLAERLRQYQPEAIAIVLRKIETHVRDATALAGITPKLYVLPFPGHGHQRKYIEKMVEIVREHAD